MKEQLAEYAHNAWSGWMEYLFSKCFIETGQFDKETDNLIIPAWAVKRWRFQKDTSYSELPENMKESDRIEADKIIAIVNYQIAKFNSQNE